VTLLALLLATLAAQQQPPTFSASVESVYVDVFVADENGPVKGLTTADFELRDNGVLQKLELVGTDAVPLTTMLLLDTSGSVTGHKLQQLQAAGRALVQQVRPGNEAGLITFSHRIRFDVAPTSDAASLLRGLDSIQPGGSTALLDALYAGAALGAARGRTILVLFTDGEDNTSVLRVPDLLPVLERPDVLLQAVGIVPANDRSGTESGHVRMLRRLAESTGGRFWAASAPERLSQAFLSIAEAMRTRYVLRFEPAGIAQQGRHTLAVTVPARRATVHHRKAYFVAPARRSAPPTASR